MGAWALKLFCTDHDLDIIHEFNEKCGLQDLERKDGKEPIKKTGANCNAQRQGEHQLMGRLSLDGVVEDRAKFPGVMKVDTNGINYSMYIKLCTHPRRVRDYLNSTGAFANAMDEYRGEALSLGGKDPGWLRDPSGSGYVICLLGACGMSLGVNLSETDKSAMRRYYKTCGFMRDAVKQLDDAIDNYVSGTPWDFKSPVLHDPLHSNPKEDELFPGMGHVNVWAPDHGRREGEMACWRAMIPMQVPRMKPSLDDLATSLANAYFDPREVLARVRTRTALTMADSDPSKYRKQAHELLVKHGLRDPEVPLYGNDVCGHCGAKEQNSGCDLLTCEGCKDRLYCSRSCQKKDWRIHKKTCRKAKQDVPPPAPLTVAGLTIEEVD